MKGTVAVAHTDVRVRSLCSTDPPPSCRSPQVMASSVFAPRDVDPTGAALKQLLSEGKPGAPLVMLNLLRFKRDSAGSSAASATAASRALYSQYARGVSPFLAAAGAEVLFSGDASNLLVAPAGFRSTDWDAILLVRYPSRSAFSRMITQPEYQRLTHLRTQALECAVLQAWNPRNLAADDTATVNDLPSML